jgi:uncharacterized 2Fe-2S/4Fe-4S cluster protein (DUF4445 family)
MFKITFKLSGGEDRTVHAAPAQNLLDVARSAGVSIDAPCGGVGNCGKCRVKLVQGELECEKSRHIADEEYAEGWRLACICKVIGDAVIEVPAEATAYQDSLSSDFTARERDFSGLVETQKKLSEAGIGFPKAFKTVRIELKEPTLDDTMPDNERLSRYLYDKYKADYVGIPFYVLKKLPEVLRENNFRIKCLIEFTRGRLTVYEVLPIDAEGFPCGVAIDIGTTSVSAVLVDLEHGKILSGVSAANQQIRYGADVIHRIVESTRPGGREALQKAVVEETINPIIRHICKEANVPVSAICRLSVASNTTMNHLFAGVYADPIRMEPYVPAFFETRPIPAVMVGVEANNNARIIITPNIGSYVGGDITAGVLATAMWNSPEMTLFVDLGTNGELVLGNSDFMMSCACSAGPAFEGGDIICGMRAANGAIDEVKIDSETMEPTLSVIGEQGQKPLGICGSGLIDVVSELYSCGIINSRGQFIREGERVRRDSEGRGRYILVDKENSASGRDIFLTEVDIDNFIRAKGAIFSAIRTMLSSLSMDVDIIERVIVAGGIGSGINMENAVKIGMLPNIPIEKYGYIGNSSLAGSFMSLVSREAYDQTLEIARNMTYLELSVIPGYMEEFVAACFIPHTDETLFT